MFLLSNNFSISCVYSRREMRNEGWLYLDNYLEKLLEDIF